MFCFSSSLVWPYLRCGWQMVHRAQNYSFPHGVFHSVNTIKSYLNACFSWNLNQEWKRRCIYLTQLWASTVSFLGGDGYSTVAVIEVFSEGTDRSKLLLGQEVFPKQKEFGAGVVNSRGFPPRHQRPSPFCHWLYVGHRLALLATLSVNKGNHAADTLSRGLRVLSQQPTSLMETSKASKPTISYRKRTPFIWFLSSSP